MAKKKKWIEGELGMNADGDKVVFLPSNFIEHIMTNK